ncbi:cupin [Streptomyces sp. TRM 70351]|uniref:cupin domain-containing protein n=1 Tax=Streptomyces sp. TRM 70351 TaxID=3116552 RepID=UPI002E7AB1F2|nr:cupin [Streptomyces sp. TRM 70351]MEE1927423.1 cupin [Streptomyces sp. TRM 70351]
MVTPPPAPAFPGGTAVSGLTVYDWPAPDGLRGGSPHVHLACTEGYVVAAGEGSLDTLTAGGPARTPLRPGAVAWFGPGTVHRAVVTGEDALRVVVVMQNGGLPEAGDAVFTFPPEVLADPVAYAAASHADDAASARRRRDLAVRGYRDLLARTAAGDTEALPRFYRQALALRRDRFPDWAERCRTGARRAADRTEEHLAALTDGRIGHLLDASVATAAPPSARRFGMCGRLDTYDLTPHLAAPTTEGTPDP